MRWPAVFAVSISVHAAVILALPAGPPPIVAPPAPVVTIEALPPAPMEVVPFEVVVLPVAAAAAAAAPAPAPAAASAAAAASRSRSEIRTAAATSTGPATDAATATASRFSTMRFSGAETAPPPKQLDFSLSGSVIDAILDKPSPEIPTPTGELRANEDGTYTKNDSVFVATIHEDGTVSFEDKPNLRVGLKLPSIRALKKHLAHWAEDPYGATPGYKEEGQSQDDEEDDVFIIPIIVGSFDLTDAAMRAIGDDPYQAKKMAFLERTFEERAEIGRKHRADQLDHAESYIQDHAKKLWARDDLSIAEKRELLFELWDDCAETGDDDLVDAGDRARTALLRFIDVHLPADSDDAYTATEVRKLNEGRSSKQRFAPY